MLEVNDDLPLRRAFSDGLSPCFQVVVSDPRCPGTLYDLVAISNSRLILHGALKVQLSKSEFSGILYQCICL